MLLVVICGMALGAAIFCTFKFPGQYEAKASLWIDPMVPDPSNTNVLNSVIEAPSMGSYRNTMAKVLGARSTARLAAQLLLNTPPAELPVEIARDETTLADAIKSTCDVRTSSDDAVLTIVAVDANPAVPALFANALADAFIAFNFQYRRASHSNAVDALAREVERLAFEHVDATSALEEYQASNLADRAEARRDELAASQKEWRAAQSPALRDRIDAETAWMAIEEIEPGELYQIAKIAEEPSVAASRVALANQAAKVRGMEQRYGDKHPLLKAERAALDVLRAELEHMCGKARDSVFARVAATQVRESEIKNEIIRIEEGLGSLDALLLEHGSLDADADAVLTRLDYLREKLFEARLSLQYVVNDLRIAERAQTPVKPQRNPAGRRFLWVAVVSLMLLLALRKRVNAHRHPDRNARSQVPEQIEDQAFSKPFREASSRDADPQIELAAEVLPADTPEPGPVAEHVLSVDSGGPENESVNVAMTEIETQAPINYAERVVDAPQVFAQESTPASDLPLEEPTPRDSDRIERTSSGDGVSDLAVEISPTFWTNLRYAPYDELEKAALNAAGAVEPWERLLSQLVAAQDLGQLTRWARHLRQAMPFGDRVRRLAEAHLARLREDHIAALRIYRSGLASLPGHPALLGGLARCALLLGDEAALLEAMQKLDETGGQSPDASYVRGTLAAGEGGVASAMNHLQQCVRSAPDVDAMVGMASLSAQNSRLEDAERTIRFALNVAPQHAVALDVLGVVLYRQRRPYVFLRKS
ncbi:MAG: hypothetical protein O3C57_02315 [Verrucomicrobia bacterium]|nr:hypothetical protein [Verrucomicrobiota bacterium]